MQKEEEVKASTRPDGMVCPISPVLSDLLKSFPLRRNKPSLDFHMIINLCTKNNDKTKSRPILDQVHLEGRCGEKGFKVNISKDFLV